MPDDLPDTLGFVALFDVHDYLDTEGRAVGEHRASKQVLQAIPMVLKQCPYPDSRFQHARPMNVSALRQLTAHWDDIIAGISFVRQQYLTRKGMPSVLCAVDCWTIAEAVACIPSYLIHRTARPARDREIDPLVGGLYKVIIGINTVYSVLVSGELMARGRTDEALPADDVATFAEARGFLIGAEQVCAGSSKQITQAIEAVVAGAPGTSSSALQALLEPLDSFLVFAEGMARLAAARLLFRIATTLAVLDLSTWSAKAPGTSSTLRATLATLVAELDAPGTIQKYATRAPEQRGRLLQGWFALAGGSGPIPKPDPALEPARAQLSMLLRLERVLLPQIEETERKLNAALGRNIIARAPDPRRISRGFGLTVLDRLGTELGVDLDQLVSHE